ncbi:unnamed protein product [Paramecium sonneborni]|uniref:Protein kinase domain-containing protein n=1 Tax=Paramecium sonneborni TaxID=65129 RepID=A0A8S1PUN8_9CILI|nr:unnamed protein product [Paramecium sonneborni]
MLCGYLPFEDANTNQLYKRILSANYKVSNFLSSNAADVLKFILNPNPDNRPNIDQIRRYPFWFNLYKTSFQIKLGILQQQILIDNDVVNQGEKLKKYLYQFLCSNQHNDVTIAFYLLLDQIIQSGGQNCADIASNQFKAQLIEVNSQTAKSEIKINMTIEDEEQDITILLIIIKSLIYLQFVDKTIINTTSINSQQIQQQSQIAPKNLSSKRSNKTEKYPMFDRLINKIDKVPLNIKSESEQQKSFNNTKYDILINQVKNYQYRLYIKKLKKKKPKIRTNLLKIQQVYGIRK